MGIKWAGVKIGGPVEGVFFRVVRAWVTSQGSKEIAVGAILTRVNWSRADCASGDTARRSPAEFGNRPTSEADLCLRGIHLRRTP